MQSGRQCLFILAAAGGLVIGCSSNPSEGSEAVDLAALSVARCAPEPVASGTATIGPEGGTITAGAHSLVIPHHSLAHPVEITMQVVGDSSRSVTFLPEGIQFHSNRPSKLTLHYSGCEFPEDSLGNPAGHLPASAGIAYLGDDEQIAEFQPGIIDTAANTITGKLRHFSRYAVAW
jgi:hypothetical protein